MKADRDKISELLEKSSGRDNHSKTIVLAISVGHEGDLRNRPGPIKMKCRILSASETGLLLAYLATACQDRCLGETFCWL